MLKPFLRRLRQFMAADVTASLDRIQLELHILRTENAALRTELAARDAKESTLAKQMEAALLTIALNREAVD
ncbi:MAG: hypothetical protein KGJ73_02095 [Rhodospirillales bacterium]|nr:hypothetical protein [Rhodospirillales bacterium]